MIYKDLIGLNGEMWQALDRIKLYVYRMVTAIVCNSCIYCIYHPVYQTTYIQWQMIYK